MSEQAAEAAPVPELGPSGNSAFADLMDVLVPDESKEAPAEGAATADAPAAGNGQPAPADQGTGAAGGAAAAPAAGDAGGTAVPGEPEVPAGADGGTAASAGVGAPDAATADARPETWTADAAGLTEKFGEVATALETKTQEGFKVTVLDEVRTEYPKYFDALAKHPRELVGMKVPSIHGEGEDTLRDSKDAAEWQDATKAILVREVNDRVEKQMEGASGYLETLHQSIDLFRNNADLIPGTKGFDVDLANRLVQLVDPYAVRVDGKLHGYSIPLQPLVNQLRATLAAERAKAPAATSSAAGATAAGAAASTPVAPAEPGDPPQAGIKSKAGNSGEDPEDMSTFWGTLGLPNLTL